MNRMHELEIMYATITASPFGRRFGAKVAADITANMARYQSVEDTTGVPAWLVGILHHMECGGDFKRHLHNGDPLHSKTINVPKGRPNLSAPWTWEQSAVDALTMPGAFKWDFTTLGRALDCIERYNGTGYQRRGINSPYLWSGSQWYERGKFVADRKYDPNAVSQQVGAAVIMRYLNVSLPTEADNYIRMVKRSNDATAQGRALQEFLNRVPSVTLTVDGKIGTKTAGALYKLTKIII